MSGGWEWPAPGEPTCGAEAEDIRTNERIACNLARGHRCQEHHWQTPPVEGQIRSATWIATGPITFIGGVPDGTNDPEYEAWLQRLSEVARDWRFSDEFIGLFVRRRWPQDYDYTAPALARAAVARAEEETT